MLTRRGLLRSLGALLASVPLAAVAAKAVTPEAAKATPEAIVYSGYWEVLSDSPAPEGIVTTWPPPPDYGATTDYRDATWVVPASA